MKTRYLLYALIFLLLLSIVNALGVAPSRKDIYFKSGSEEKLSFRLINNNHIATDILLIVNGDLKEYVSMQEYSINISPGDFEKNIPYTLNFPDELPPGLHVIEIMAVATGKASPEEGNILQANVGVIHKLFVSVPYPEEYLQGILFISDARPNEEVTFTVSLINAGSDLLEEIEGQVIITGPDNYPVAIKKTNTISLYPEKKSKVTAIWNASVNPGTYHAQAAIRYANDKVLILEKTFDVGEPMIVIEGLRIGPFKLGTIAKFGIKINNKWNKEITGVFGETEISDDRGVVIDQEKTSSIDLPPVGIGELNAFWDTSDISPGNFLIAIRVNYFSRVREKVYELVVREDAIEVKELGITGEVVKPAESQNSMILTIASIILGILFGALFVKKVHDRLYRGKKVVTPAKEYSRLKKYIREKIEKGYSIEAIREDLLDKGWNRKAIDKKLLQIEDELD